MQYWIAGSFAFGMSLTKEQVNMFATLVVRVNSFEHESESLDGIVNIIHLAKVITKFIKDDIQNCRLFHFLSEFFSSAFLPTNVSMKDGRENLYCWKNSKQTI